jgi:hypothetical protein
MYLYRTDKAERFEDLIDLENQLAKREDTKVDLYKIAGDLAVVFLNNTDPYDDTDSIVYRMLFGRQVRTGVDFAEIGGFLPSSMIPEITTWIKEKGIHTYDGFSKIYNNLSDEVKQWLQDMATDDKNGLFSGYVRPLVVLYFTALEEGHSVIFEGEAV